MTIEITRESFTKAMRDAIAERGKDYRYDSHKYAGPPYSATECHYVTPEGAPDCLIGAVLANLGHPLPEFSVMISADEMLPAEYGVRDEALIEAASRAQTAQDHGLPWGEVLARFERTLVELELA